MTEQREHSDLIGGSTAKRRINCPGSYKLEKAAPTPPESHYAAHGTMMHHAIETVLLEDIDPELLVSEDGVTQDDVDDLLRPALHAFDDLLAAYGIADLEYDIEARVEFPGIGAFGTCDVIGHSDTHTLVLDWKFGAGVAVEGGADNEQLKFYAAAAMVSPATADHFAPDRKVVLAIVQPAAGGLTHGVICFAELEAFRDTVYATVDTIRAGADDLNPGAWCKFCKGAAACPVKVSQAEMLASAPPADPSMDPDELGRLTDLANAVEDWSKEVKKLAHAELEKGRAVTGYKLVAKRATRKWVDEDEVAARVRELGNEITVEAFEEPKLRSPAQLEKALKRHGMPPDALDEYVVAESTGTTLASEDDKRPAVNRERTGGNLELPANP
jgi:hypothetical protein